MSNVRFWLYTVILHLDYLPGWNREATYEGRGELGKLKWYWRRRAHLGTKLLGYKRVWDWANEADRRGHNGGGYVITNEINADPAEVERLRLAREQARNGETTPWRQAMPPVADDKQELKDE